jgi:hypothetical protein
LPSYAQFQKLQRCAVADGQTRGFEHTRQGAIEIEALGQCGGGIIRRFDHRIVGCPVDAFPDSQHVGIGGSSMGGNGPKIDQLDGRSGHAEIQREDEDDRADDPMDRPHRVSAEFV